MVRFGTDPYRARIKTGTYTGDGSTSQAITGIGFQPKMVTIWIYSLTEGNTGQLTKIDQFATDMAIDAWGTPHFIRDNRLISLDADGFTVDDDGTDDFPNTNGATYAYIAFG